MLANDKALLRRMIRDRYPGDDIRRMESEELCRRILQWDRYRDAQCIGGYVPLRREADVTPVMEDALHQGKTLVLPRCDAAPHMTLRLVRSMDELTTGRWGIPEPAEDTEIIPAEKVDLLIVPLEGLDRSGKRLGKGGGYYDCLLSSGRCFTLGAVMSWQWVDNMPCDAWDQGLNAAVDHQGICIFGEVD